jgi:hypothetical protein
MLAAFTIYPRFLINKLCLQHGDFTTRRVCGPKIPPQDGMGSNLMDSQTKILYAFIDIVG